MTAREIEKELERLPIHLRGARLVELQRECEESPRTEPSLSSADVEALRQIQLSLQQQPAALAELDAKASRVTQLSEKVKRQAKTLAGTLDPESTSREQLQEYRGLIDGAELCDVFLATVPVRRDRLIAAITAQLQTLEDICKSIAKFESRRDAFNPNSSIQVRAADGIRKLESLLA